MIVNTPYKSTSSSQWSTPSTHTSPIFDSPTILSPITSNQNNIVHIPSLSPSHDLLHIANDIDPLYNADIQEEQQQSQQYEHETELQQNNSINKDTIEQMNDSQPFFTDEEQQDVQFEENEEGMNTSMNFAELGTTLYNHVRYFSFSCILNTYTSFL